MIKPLAFLALGLLLACKASAQPGPTTEFPLSSAPAPAGAAPEQTDVRDGMRIVRNVSVATLTPFLPDPGTANGTAVIIAPGGAFMMLSFDGEGTLVAKWLARRGVAAFVLKYRLEQTPPSGPAFMLALMSRMGAARPPPGATAPAPFKTEGLAAADAAAAVRLVRGRAAGWGLDPHRIGFLGFSAGAITATAVATATDAADRPDFVGVIYGALRRPVPTDAPPAFFATAADDPLLANAAEPMFDAWRAARRPAELHLYERGGHGFGLVPKGASSDHWLDEFFWWMQSLGLIKPSDASQGRAP